MSSSTAIVTAIKVAPSKHPGIKASHHHAPHILKSGFKSPQRTRKRPADEMLNMSSDGGATPETVTMPETRLTAT